MSYFGYKNNDLSRLIRRKRRPSHLKIQPFGYPGFGFVIIITLLTHNPSARVCKGSLELLKHSENKEGSQGDWCSLCGVLNSQLAP